MIPCRGGQGAGHDHGCGGRSIGGCRSQGREGETRIGRD